MKKVDLTTTLVKPIVAWKLVATDGGRPTFEHQSRYQLKIGKPMRAKEVQIMAGDGKMYTTGFHTYRSRADARKMRRRRNHLRVVKVLIWGPATYGVQYFWVNRGTHKWVMGYTARFMEIVPLRKEGGA